MRDLRICIVGAGQLSTKRIYPYIGAAGAELVGVCDLDLEKAKTNARLWGGRAYRDLDQMLATERPDGVMICVGPEAHCQLAQHVLRAGFPVYTEKPPAPSAVEALQVAEVAAQTGLLCSTAFKKRYCRAYTRAKEWLGGFTPDDHVMLSIDYASGPYSNNSARSSFILDFAIHVIDLAAYLFGDVAELTCLSKGKEAYAVNLRFVSGAVGTLSLNCHRSFGLPTEEVEITVRGGNFMSVHNSSRWRIVEGGAAVEWREPPTFVSAGDSGYETGHLSEIEDFFAALREERTTCSEIAESYKSMVLYEAIVEASKHGRLVPVKYEHVGI